MAVTDDQILLKMGLTETEVSDLETKFSDLAKSLDPAQRDTLQKSTPTPEDAAKTLGPDVTAERLMEFIRARAPLDATMVVCFNGGGGGHGHDKSD